jgi:hypothetical protein
MIRSRLCGTNKPPVRKTLTGHTTGGHFDEAHCTRLSGVVAEGELVDVAVQVLGAHVVIDTIMAALQERPKALNPIGVSLVPNVLADRVIDADMVKTFDGKADVTAVLIGYNR